MGCVQCNTVHASVTDVCEFEVRGSVFGEPTLQLHHSMFGCKLMCEAKCYNRHRQC